MEKTKKYVSDMGISELIVKSSVSKKVMPITVALELAHFKNYPKILKQCQKSVHIFEDSKYFLSYLKMHKNL